ncbi:hypothetical protein H6P81_001168 [Aristolochia fimbriata]|uniref:Uncharacterized protein n=1 Tax=Aristolochia fimbriata TaxID=158543 RepID=A0AAV7F635_ARIFI|nr:hypothetical protein H6P81_001168 [Aristolochia fimbriata]
MASEAAKASIFEGVSRKNLFRPNSQSSLPISRSGSGEPPVKEGKGLRRRLSSISLRIQPLSYSSSAASWAFRRSKSMPAIGDLAGDSLRKWWDWGWSWVLSRKPTFARDLEMNEEETAMLGCHSRGSWRHVFYKVRSELRKLVGSGPNLPTTNKFGYDSFSYAQNFDDGGGARRSCDS